MKRTQTRFQFLREPINVGGPFCSNQVCRCKINDTFQSLVKLKNERLGVKQMGRHQDGSGKWHCRKNSGVQLVESNELVCKQYENEQ